VVENKKIYGTQNSALKSDHWNAVQPMNKMGRDLCKKKEKNIRGENQKIDDETLITIFPMDKRNIVTLKNKAINPVL
jgi:hypothetical protein